MLEHRSHERANDFAEDGRVVGQEVSDRVRQGEDPLPNRRVADEAIGQERRSIFLAAANAAWAPQCASRSRMSTR